MSAHRSLKSTVIRSVYAFVGVILIGLGAAVLKTGDVGLDPYTALNVGIAAKLGWSLGSYQLLSNLVLFIPVLIWGRKYIGPGTIINMVLTGFFIDIFAGLLAPLAPASATLLSKTVFFLVGILIFAFGASAYMSARVGTAPYDAIAPMIVGKTGWKYGRVRVPQDIIVVILAVLVHGPVGFGTVVTAFFNGPLIQLFSEKINIPLATRLAGDDPSDAHSTQAKAS
ncbi:YczE/YyaS/YitT family protein [Microbacterium gorillae]|uniref:YczE/YyaS/YitT family protein n=1 Tax=Microbacterium gorillae TaxID=1231063 RepID=UPI00058ED0E4|nr:YitT family protein [Microbacterium gorillae]